MEIGEGQRREIADARAAERPTRRAVAPGLEEILYEPLPVLDHGFVRVVDYMGDDGAIVQAARVSYGRGTRRVSKNSQPTTHKSETNPTIMNQSLSEIAFVLDRSGSMESIREATINGFNAFLETQQQAPGLVRLTLNQFDDEQLIVHDAVPVAEIVPLNLDTYVPRASTALLDAIGDTIDRLGQRPGQARAQDLDRHRIARQTVAQDLIGRQGFAELHTLLRVIGRKRQALRGRTQYEPGAQDHGIGAQGGNPGRIKHRSQDRAA
jgi:hypothetical protein